jgi:sulfite reductase (NADPH) flavoprotein alpha-component
MKRSAAERRANNVARSLAARLQHHPANTKVFEGYCSARRLPAPTLSYLLAPDRKQDLQTYLWGMEVMIFSLSIRPCAFTPEEFVGLLSKMQPRLYSVASSLKAFPDQVHLIVDVVRYESNGRLRKGVASSFLAERADDVPVPVFPSNAKHFHLPENPDTPIIMVGPAQVLRRFERICRNARSPAQKEKTGSSSARST